MQAGTSYVTKGSSPKELGQVTSVANPSTLKMLIEKCNYLPVEMTGFTIFVQAQLLPDVKRKT
jgi:hypothetical protein